ncbi:hypothetical protein Q5530_10200 [Saccharothrix sp. BKS2]|uniref:Uncharacterized protein n=1 Tax=Saccharothrix lopnurensis TaxID=1670621 RepID=A0ABW1P3D5_9PSEU
MIHTEADDTGVCGVDEVLARLLDERVGDYLDAVDRLGARGGAPGLEARRLAAAWRALLGVHRRTPAGRCRRCVERGRMCAVWRVACAYFVHRLPFDRGVRR